MFCALAVACGKPKTQPAPWEAVTIPTDAIFEGISFTDSLNGWVTGGGYLIDGGIIGRTRDGGKTWRFWTGLLDAGTSSGLGSIQFRDTLNGCGVGSGGCILLTSDGGVTWRQVRSGRSSGDGLGDVQFIDDWNGWAVGGASLLRTEDGGETWRPLIYGSYENGYFSGNAIHFLDLSHGWLVAHGGVLKRTYDGGQTWSRVELPLAAGERPTFWDVTFCDASHGWIVGETGAIFHTEDGGTTWLRQENGVPIVRVIPKGEPRRPRERFRELEWPADRLTLSAVRFLDPLRGWAVGYYSDVGESVVIGTRDGGASWSVERIQPGEYLGALFLLDRTHVWAAGDRSRTQPQVVLRYPGGP